MLLGDVRVTPDDVVQLYDVDGSVQCELTVEDALTLLDKLVLRQHLLHERYRQQLAKAKAKETDQ